ncbi:unnamed protein product [Sphagnum balticum]
MRTNRTLDWIELTYPLASVAGEKIMLIGSLYDVQLDADYDGTGVTNMKWAKVIGVYYLFDVDDEQQRYTYELEDRLHESIGGQRYSPLLNVTVFGDKSAFASIQEATDGGMPYIFMGITMLTVFVGREFDEIFFKITIVNF